MAHATTVRTKPPGRLRPSAGQSTPARWRIQTPVRRAVWPHQQVGQANEGQVAIGRRVADPGNTTVGGLGESSAEGGKGLEVIASSGPASVEA